MTGLEPADLLHGKQALYQLSYIRVVVGETGIEPATFCSQSRRATSLRYSPLIGASGRTRTYDARQDELFYRQLPLPLGCTLA